MGAWGYDSCSNDSCWDNLLCEDIHQPTESEMKKSLREAERLLISSNPFNKEIYLGIAIWALRHNVRVEKTSLNQALGVANHLLENEEYLSSWNSSEERRSELGKEKSLLIEALENSGLALNKQAAPEGLLSKIIKGES